MYATASEAMEGLKHKRTGEILPSKTVARNTKLLYLDEDLVGLRFHDTIIARYERDGVVIDTRDRYNGKGWFTVTTWNRIDQFTPARTFQENGLRKIVIDPGLGWGSAQLYAHGAHVSPDGSCEIPDLSREQSEAIVATKKNFGARVKRYAAKVVKDWREWEMPRDCCRHAANSEDEDLMAHMFGHFKRKEPAVPPSIEMLASQPRGSMLDPEALAAEVTRRLYEQLQSQFLPLAIAQIAPEFPYPQIAPRRR